MSHCCVVAFCPCLTGNPTNPTGHTSLRNPQHPRPVCCDIACFELGFGLWGEISQHTPGGGHLPMFAHTRWRFKSSVLRYLDFRPGLGTDLRDIAAQYPSDLIKGAEPQNARHSPLSSGASHVPALPPVPGTPRPLGSQEQPEPLGSRPVFQPVLLENAAQYGHEPPYREAEASSGSKPTPARLCVLRYRTNQAPNPASNPNIAAQCSTHQPNQPLPPPTNASKMQHATWGVFSDFWANANSHNQISQHRVEAQPGAG